MLEKLITNLKKSLQGVLGKKSEDDSDENEESLENEEVTTEDSDSESETDSSEDEKKKKTTMIIRVVLILVIGYFAADHFILSGDKSEPSIDEMLANAPKPKRKKPTPKPETTSEAAPETTPETAPTDAPVAESGTEISSELSPETSTDTTSPPVENVNVLPKDESPVEPPVILSPEAEKAAAQEAGKSELEEVVTQNLPEASPQPETPTETPVETPAEAPAPEPTVVDDVMKPVEKEVTSSNNMLDKIVETPVETAAPKYDQFGRGLVYNCKDKHWACIDKPSYVQCNKNMKWNKSQGNAAECVIQNVYNTEEDCSLVQKYNVSTNQATTFCQ